MQWFKVPPKIYFEHNSIEYLHQMQDVSKVIIVTDQSMVKLGYVDKVTDQLKLRRNDVTYELFCDVEPDPSIQTVKKDAISTTENSVFLLIFNLIHSLKICRTFATQTNSSILS